MSRLIDADKLNKKLTEKALTQRNTPLVECRELIHDAPTVDAVEVVRCKDCIHNDQCKHRVVMWVEDPINTWHKDIDFCSYGERKEK